MKIQRWVGTLGLGLALCLSMPAQSSNATETGPPAGFHPLFDGKDLKGWHFSATTHHGTTGNASVENGELVLRQRPYGQGGILMSDREYKNFELYVEVKELWGCNSGIFLRSTEAGSAYQVELAPASNNAGLIGELIHLSKGAPATDLAKVWKDGEFNSFRVRMQGDAPHVTLWVNGVQMWDVQEPVNDKIAGETSGHIGLQLHWGSTYDPALSKNGGLGSWKPDAALHFRNVAIKELP